MNIIRSTTAAMLVTVTASTASLAQARAAGRGIE